MSIHFKKLEHDPTIFFDILPNDWKEGIVPFWDDYKDSSSIYILEEYGQIIGGGIEFSKCPPDLLYYVEEANSWFNKNYHYLGYIWISEHKRNQNLGTFWLENLKQQYPNQNYWLITEEEHLHRFYQKNNFILNKTIVKDDLTEWLYTLNSSSS